MSLQYTILVLPGCNRNPTLSNLSASAAHTCRACRSVAHQPVGVDQQGHQHTALPGMTRLDNTVPHVYLDVAEEPELDPHPRRMPAAAVSCSRIHDKPRETS
jgi:hypothetical protein